MRTVFSSAGSLASRNTLDSARWERRNHPIRPVGAAGRNGIRRPQLSISAELRLNWQAGTTAEPAVKPLGLPKKPRRCSGAVSAR